MNAIEVKQYVYHVHPYFWLELDTHFPLLKKRTVARDEKNIPH